MRKFIGIVCSLALVAGTMTTTPILAANDVDQSMNDGDVIENPYLEFTTIALKGAVITSHPSSVTAEVGQSVVLRVTADNAKSYQWQYCTAGSNEWKNSSSVDSTFTFNMKESFDGRTYRCAVTGEDGITVVSNAATITLKSSGAVITSHPSSVTAAAGERVVLNVTATNATAYQWQYSKDGGSTWTNASNTTNTFSFDMKDSFDGRIYRCEVTGKDGKKVQSGRATITLKKTGAAAVITTQPGSVTAVAGQQVVLKVVASNATAYQWQYSKDNGATWTNASNTTDTFSFAMKDTFNGRIYRCAVTGTDGKVVNSNNAKITLGQAAGSAVITKQPSSVTAAAGQDVVLSVTATGAKAYQWQYSKDGGATWTNASNTTDTFSFVMKETFNGRIYRCQVTGNDGVKVNSQNAVITYAQSTSSVNITKQPSSVSAKVGDGVVLSVTATGAKAYQWQYSKDNGATWTNASNTTSTFSFTMKESFAGRIYRCAITGVDGTVKNSDNAKISLSQESSSVNITTQPGNKSAAVGEVVVLKVVATGAKAYQWQYSKDNGVTWTNASNTTNEFSFAMKESFNGRIYRCEITGTDNLKKYSSTAKITLK